MDPFDFGSNAKFEAASVKKLAPLRGALHRPNFHCQFRKEHSGWIVWTIIVEKVIPDRNVL